MVDGARLPHPSRREAILAAAEREFAAAGYAGGRIERIAARARVNKQLLFHYFESKDGLFAAAVESLLTRLEPAAAPHASPVEELRTHVAALQEAARAVPGVIGLLAAALQVNERSGPADAVLRAWHARQAQRLATTLAEGQRRGYFRDDFDPAAVAGIAIALALGAGATGADGPAAAAMIADHCAWR